MNKKRICFVLYNRSNYGRLKPILQLAKLNPQIELQIVVSSSGVLSKYGNLRQILKKDKFKVNYFFYSHIEGENNFSMTKSTGLIIIELSSIFKQLSPHIVVTIGDRFETIATATCASYMNIYLAHIQGGELTGSIDEKIRHAVTKLSNLHLVSTKKSKQIVCQMGEDKKNVFNVGCPSVDIIKNLDFKKSVNLKKYGYGIGSRVNLKNKYYVVLLHPNTERKQQNKNIIKNLLKAINNKDIQTVWLWPNIDAGSDIITSEIRKFREIYPNNKINFYKNFETEDYLKLIKKCSCLIGNSSSGIRESSYLGIPVVNIGDRQSNRERGPNVLDCKDNYKSILNSINIQENNKFRSSKIYGDGNSSKKIINLLIKSPTKIIKKFNVL